MRLGTRTSELCSPDLALTPRKAPARPPNANSPTPSHPCGVQGDPIIPQGTLLFAVAAACQSLNLLNVTWQHCIWVPGHHLAWGPCQRWPRRRCPRLSSLPTRLRTLASPDTTFAGLYRCRWRLYCPWPPSLRRRCGSSARSELGCSRRSTRQLAGSGLCQAVRRTGLSQEATPFACKAFGKLPGVLDPDA